MTLREFIDYLARVEDEGSPVRFDMDKTARHRASTSHPCGSACCIGGHAALILQDHLDDPDKALAKLTGIPNEDARKICWPEQNEAYLASLADALVVLNHYERTKEVRWDLVLEDEE